MRVIIDTNIFFAGLISRHGHPAKILDAVMEGEIISALSRQTFQELEDVLRRPPFTIIPLPNCAMKEGGQ